MDSPIDKEYLPIVFWQPILSPHQTPLFEQLVADWPAPVHLVVNQEVDLNREEKSGWRARPPEGVFMTTKGNEVPERAIHIVSGFHGTRPWRNNLRRILRCKEAQIWIMAESLETWDQAYKTFLRLAKHSIGKLKVRRKLTGFLAIGQNAESQARLLGVPREKIYPFCYVTSPPDASLTNPRSREAGRESIILFLGALIKRKGIDVLFESSLPAGARLQVIGTHIDKSITIPSTVEHLGVIPNADVSEFIRRASVLVLPSRHDGWGAVINEALLVGTPVICTSACGGATLIQSNSPFRGVVIEDLNPDTLSQAIKEVMNEDVDHDLISSWASKTISPAPVSHYLTNVLSGNKSVAPWVAQ